MLDICVNFCIDIQLLIEKSGKLNMKNIPILATLVHFRDTLDSISIIVRKGNKSGVSTLLRTLFEASITLQYLLQAPEKKGVIAYSVGYFRNELNSLEIFDPQKKKGKSYLAAKNNDFKNVPGFKVNAKKVNSCNNDEYIKQLNFFLQQKCFQEVNNKFEIEKLENNGWDPIWYKLYNKNYTLRTLAKLVELESFYELFYSHLSRHQHASDSLSKIELVPGFGVSLPRIRDYKGMQEEIKWVMTIVQFTFSATFKSYFIDNEKAYSIWQKNNISDFIDRLDNNSSYSK